MIGEKIKTLRETNGLSQRELAEKASVSQGMISQIERGSKSPTIAVAQKFHNGIFVTIGNDSPRLFPVIIVFHKTNFINA